MTLYLHRADGTDVLADALAGLLATPLPDPFETDVVVVPAKGVERWLSQRLSHHLGTSPGRGDGVCAGVEFRTPASLVASLLDDRPHDRSEDPWAPDALAWPLLRVIDAALGEDWCPALSAHLGHGFEGEEAELRRGRRYAVARRLAGLFSSYAAQRPEMLADWQRGTDADGAGGVLDEDLTWQAELWRRLVAEVGEPTPGERLASVLALLGEDPGRVALPQRLSLFGHTRIPRTEVALLRTLGRHRDVHLWLPHPSPALWDALAGQQGTVPRADDDSHERVEHPLLASLGRDLRELQRGLGELDADGDLVPGTAPRRDDLLGWLQSDLVANRAPSPVGRVVGESDDSVQVHACHGPARQVEVLRETILGLLERHRDLEPRDIVVMCPDIEAFAPLIQAAFGMGTVGMGVGGDSDRHPGHQLEVRLADRSLTQTNPLLGVLGQVLELAGGRAEASRVRDLVAAEPVRRRFGFSESDLETIDSWIAEAGIRWAFDAEHREEYGLAAYVQNSWRFGLDRILAGVAVSDDARRYFATTLPLDDVGSTSIDLAGRLAELVDRLAALADRLRGAHPLEHWVSALGDVVDQLTAVGWGEEWQVGQVNRELAAIRAGAGGEADLRLADVRALIGERLAGRPTRANFRTGTLTVATLVPMRSVPHRVVCLLGLDDGVFPRAGAVDGDDVLGRRPLTGERDVRSEDRQLMLDAILAARDHLVVTYTGANETTGRPRPPSVPLDELLDTLEATAPGAREHVLRQHPLQATGARNFDPQESLAFAPGTPFSFDAAALAGARVAVADRPEPTPIGAEILPARTGDVDLAELVRFLKDPVKEFLRQRLQVSQLDEGEETSDGIPVDLDGLERWQIGDRILGDLLAGRTREDALATEWRRGVLPPGRLGWKVARTLADQAQPLAEAAESFRAGMPMRAVDVDLDLGAGRRLRGTVTDLYGDRLVRVSFSSLGPKHILDAWVPLLALCAAQPGRHWSAGAIGRYRRGHARATFAAVPEAPALLADLVALYDAGLSAPLPLPLKTGYAWAQHRKYPQQALFKARQAWALTQYGPESAEAAQIRVWGQHAPLEVLLDPPRPGEEFENEKHRLGALASRLWVPILARQR
ncbi:MAG: exodeoxyribonuclease V subunit gamma [Nocardioidaceae bacterium]|nr:exodeoxyribonuclease V subunit gamma [Nocardioidaceae bacterium]